MISQNHLRNRWYPFHLNHEPSQYRKNWFNFNLQPFITCCEILHDMAPMFTISRTLELCFTKNGTSCIRFSKLLPATSSTKVLLSSFIQPRTTFVVIVCTLWLMWPTDVQWFWRAISSDMAFGVSKYPLCNTKIWTIRWQKQMSPISSKACCTSRYLWNGTLSMRMNLFIFFFYQG